MSARVTQIYEAALRAISDALPDSGGQGQLTALAEKAAAAAGLKPAGNFLDTALLLGPEQQGALLWHLNKQIDAPALRVRISGLLAERMRQIVPVPVPGHADTIEALKSDGFLRLPNLANQTEIGDIVGYLQGCPNLIRQDTVLYHEARDVIRAPHAMRIATDERVLAAAYHHLGAAPLVMQMDAWWSLPQSEEPIGAQVFHRDRDDFRACKLFLYLSDVGPGDGPHIFVRGSHREDFVQHALAEKALGAEAGAFFAGNGRQVAQHIEGIFGPAVSEITGPAGTSFLENTYGFHRGKVPQTGRRCVLQVLYAAVPFPARLERWKSAALKVLPPDCADTPLARNAVCLAAPPA